MSRHDIVVNTLLGFLLVFIFFVYLTAILLIALYGFTGLDWVARRVLPGTRLPAGISVFVVWALVWLWYGIQDVRKKRWRNAFLNFIGAPLMGWALLTLTPSSIGGSGRAPLFWFPVMMVLIVAGDAALSRLNFFLAAAVAAAFVSVNTGLLGSVAHGCKLCTRRGFRMVDCQDPH